MGYYVNGYGSLEFPADMEAELVQSLKDLNHRHELKRGGQHPKVGDPYEDTWFSWMPSRYHEDESLTTVADILELVGFDCSENKRGEDIVLSLNYDSKTGCEQLFIEHLGLMGAKLNMHWEGEDHEEWEVQASNKTVQSRESSKSWSDWGSYSVQDQIAEYQKIVKAMTNAID